MISAISWVSELIEAAGGIDIFADRRGGNLATRRFVTADEVVAHAPDLISGLMVRQTIQAPSKLAARTGFDQLPAVRVRHCTKSSRRSSFTRVRRP